MPNILIVEDDDQLREILGRALEHNGFRYETAANGRIALEKLCESTAQGKMYDCMLLDIMMPEIDGWQVLAAVKNNPLWAPIEVIVLTAYANSPADIARIDKYDGVHIEKKDNFVRIVGQLLNRLLVDT